MDIKKSLAGLLDAISIARKKNVELSKNLDNEKAVYDYDEKQKIYYVNNLKTKLKIVKSDILGLPQLIKEDIRNEPIVNDILEMVPELDSRDLIILGKVATKMLNLVKQLSFPKEKIQKSFVLKAAVPSEVKAEVKADLLELNKCYNSGCYRSAIILCGRLLETALHRKYYEVTGNDLLEKSPGIGLGNIIAKLKDRDILIDPGLTNQIHLINQVRIFSVHKKKEAFNPSQQQTQAMILYTLDILEKLFK